MKNFILITTALLLTMSMTAQKKNKKEDIFVDTYLLKGKVHEVDMLNETDKSASEVHVVVYQENDIYVAFFTQKDGTYEFQLPIGHTYEVWYGGSAFVNKKVAIDAKQLQPGKQMQTLPMDIGLFRPIDGYEFELLKEPYVQVVYDSISKTLTPDLEYTQIKSDEIAKIFRKIKKEQGKKPKANL